MIEFSFNFLTPAFLLESFFWVLRLWFLWLPFVLGYFFWNLWQGQAQLNFLKGVSWKLLEIKVPREVAKGPLAMEAVLNSLYSTYKGERWKRFKEGFLPNWYSMEIVSINGQIHFFIYTQESSRNLLESQIYAQYPDAEIVEVDDYTKAGNFENLNEWDLWGVEFGLAKEDVYPIRTYVDFGLHQTETKEEQKVNPLVSFVEFLGSLKQGEQIWFQIMIRGAGKKWAEAGKKMVDKLMGRKKEESKNIFTKTGDFVNEFLGITKPATAAEEKKSPALSKGEQEVISAIERNVSKLGFETGIRSIYIAKKDLFNRANKAALVSIMNQYNTQNLNGFKPAKKTEAAPLEPILKERRESASKRVMLDAYRKRSYFSIPHKRKPFIFNTEELATIYHFPGRVAETPTFARIEAKKGEPPANLPI